MRKNFHQNNARSKWVNRRRYISVSLGPKRLSLDRCIDYFRSIRIELQICLNKREAFLNATIVQQQRQIPHFYVTSLVSEKQVHIFHVVWCHLWSSEPFVSSFGCPIAKLTLNKTHAFVVLFDTVLIVVLLSHLLDRFGTSINLILVHHNLVFKLTQDHVGPVVSVSVSVDVLLNPKALLSVPVAWLNNDTRVDCCSGVVLVSMQGFMNELVQTNVALLIKGWSYCPNTNSGVQAATNQQRSGC